MPVHWIIYDDTIMLYKILNVCVLNKVSHLRTLYNYLLLLCSALIIMEFGDLPLGICLSRCESLSLREK